jgi:quercetin dioxygenase-like cupin family protein
MIALHRPMRDIALLAMLGVAVVGLGLFAARPLGHQIMSADHASMMASSGKIIATKISEEKLAHVPGKTVTVEIVEFPPGAVAAEHHHAGSVTAYILSGTLRSQLGGGPAILYKAGESFFEPPGAVHVLAENPSATEPARFMAIHVADDGAQLTVYH